MDHKGPQFDIIRLAIELKEKTDVRKTRKMKCRVNSFTHFKNAY